MPRSRERLFVKLDDYDGLSAEQINRFAGCEFPNKVFFTANKDWRGLKCAVHIPSRNGKLPDGWTLRPISPRYFDSASWIGGRRQPDCKLLSFV